MVVPTVYHQNARNNTRLGQKDLKKTLPNRIRISESKLEILSDKTQIRVEKANKAKHLLIQKIITRETIQGLQVEPKKPLTKMIRYLKRQKTATINSHKPKLSQCSLSRRNLWLKTQKMDRLTFQSRKNRKIFPELCRLTQLPENLRKKTNTWQLYSKVKQIRETNHLSSLRRILY